MNKPLEKWFVSGSLDFQLTGKDTGLWADAGCRFENLSRSIPPLVSFRATLTFPGVRKERWAGDIELLFTVDGAMDFAVQ